MNNSSRNLQKIAYRKIDKKSAPQEYHFEQTANFDSKYVDTLAKIYHVSNSAIYCYIFSKILFSISFVNEAVCFDYVSKENGSIRFSALDVNLDSLYVIDKQINHEQAMLTQTTNEDIVLSYNTIPPKRAPYLLFSIDATKDHFSVSCTASYETFDLFFTKLMVDLFIQLIQQPLGNLQICPNIDKERLRYFNATKKDYPSENIIKYIEKWSAVYPNSIAIQCNDTLLTYHQLMTEIDQSAKQLYQSGIRKGHIVAICRSQSISTIVILLALIKIEACFMPLDPGFPIDRIWETITETQADYILFENDISLHNYANGSIEQVDHCLWRFSWNKSDVRNIQDAAYILFTSGSSGKPKGISIPRTAFTNVLLSFRDILNFTKDDTFLAMTTLTFDISLLEIFLPFVSGGTCFLAFELSRNGFSAVMQEIEKYNVTFMQTTPTVWNALLRAGFKGNPQLNILCGGEVLDSILAKKLNEIGKNVWNVYGPTETTIWSTAHHVEDSCFPLIGKPIHNTSVHIVSPSGEVLPIGIIGEICISGAGLALEYLNDTKQTNTHFGEYVKGLNCRVYKTGDMARWLPDGNIEFFSKTDHFIKINSIRISLLEIEQKLLENENIQNAVVHVSSANGNQQLLAYVITTKNDLTEKNILSWLSSRLPSYMIPQKLFIVDILPTNANNKKMRSVMATTISNNLIASTIHVSHIVHKLEQVLVQIGFTTRTKTGDFLDITLDSLTLLTLLFHLEECNVVIPQKELFSCRHFSDLLLILQNAVSNIPNINEQHKIRNNSQILSMQSIDMTPMQKNMWVNMLLYRDQRYVCINSITVVGPLNIGKMMLAFNMLVNETDCLRTVYRKDMKQLVHDDKKAIINVHDNRKAQIDVSEIINMNFTPFRANEVPFKCLIIRNSENENILVFYYHHVMLDGISYSLLVKRLFCIYDFCLGGKESLLPQSRHTFLELMTSESYVVREKPMREHLNSFIRYAPFNTRSDTTIIHSRIKSLEFCIPPEAIKKIELISQQNKVSINSVIQALIVEAFAYQYDVNVIYYDLVYAGRPSGYEDAIGMFIYTIPVYCSSAHSIHVTASEINEIVLAAMQAKLYDTQGNELLSKNLMGHDRITPKLLITFENEAPIHDIDSILVKHKCKITQWDCAEATEKDVVIYIQGNGLNSRTIRICYNSSTCENDQFDKLKSRIVKRISNP